MVVDLVVIGAGAALIALLAWYFFGPKKAGQAQLVGQIQEVRVTVRGGYSPDLIRVRQVSILDQNHRRSTRARTGGGDPS